MKLNDVLKEKPTKINGKLTDFKLSLSQPGKIVAIARHGSTDSNGEKVFRGWQETGQNQLSDKGKKDAEKMGEKIKQLIGSENPNHFVIVTSDLNRARDSAEIASEISGVPLGKEYKTLRSQDTGDYSGKKEADVKQKIQEAIKGNPNKPLPGASESHNQFLNRVETAFDSEGQIAKDYPGKKIIVITHHQVEVEQANDFNSATDAMFADGMEPGEVRPA